MDSDEETKQERTPDVEALSRLHVWQVQAVRDVLFVGAVIALVWFGYALRAVTVPLLVALFLAYLFEPLVQRVSSRPGVARTHVVGGLIGIACFVVIVFALIVTPLLVHQTANLVGGVKDGSLRLKVAQLEQYVPEEYREDFQGYVRALPGPAVEEGDAAPPPDDAGAPDDVAAADEPLTEARVREIVAAELASGGEEESGPAWFDLARGGAGAIADVIGAIVQVSLLSFLIPFYFFFFSVYFPEIVGFLERLLPTKNRDRTLELLGKMDRVVSGFVRGRIVISLMMGVLLAIGWMLCGVPYAIVLGLVVGIFCAVPYLGGVGIPLAIGFLFFERLGATDNEGLWWLWTMVWPTVVFVVVQFIEGYVLTPLIAGKATNLDPVTLIVAVLAGGSVMGVYGMLLAVPLAACLRILVTDVLMPRVREWAEGRATDPLPIDRD